MRPTELPVSGADKLTLIAVGAYEGGEEALDSVFKHLPPLNNCCFVVVQGKPITLENRLWQAIAQNNKWEVAEASHAFIPQAGKVYLIPENQWAMLHEGYLRVEKSGNSQGAIARVNKLLLSLVHPRPCNVVAIILSGTGTDGALGVEALKYEENTLVLVQDPQTAAHSGLPLAAIQTGCADLIIAPDKMGDAIHRFSENPATFFHTLLLHEVKRETTINRVIQLLDNYTGSDFSNYNDKVLLHHIARRTHLRNLPTVEAYAQLLEDDQQELKTLFDIVLEKDTSFFREFTAFDALQQALRIYISQKKNAEAVRIWVPGCSTGEEAYSIAMMCDSVLTELNRKLEVQIFATDIDLPSLVLARKGEYSVEAITHLPKQIQSRYFTVHEQRALVVPHLKSNIIFSRHDLIVNPPFQKIDLISCRNVLMYFNASLQNKIISLFHFALQPQGIMLLGYTEKIGGFTDLFQPYDKKNKLYKRKSGKQKLQLIGDQSENILYKLSAAPAAFSDFHNQIKTAMQSTLDYPYVVINENYTVKEIGGAIDKYLSMPDVRLQLNINTILHPELQTMLTDAVSKANRDRTTTTTDQKHFTQAEVENTVRLHVKPFRKKVQNDLYFLIVFEEQELPASQKTDNFIINEYKVAEEQATIIALSHELAATKDHLQTFIEELETRNNELQLVNEKLENTKKEIESRHGEIEQAYVQLKTTHNQLLQKEQEIEMIRAHQKALLDNNLQAFLLVDASYAILDFNEQAQAIFKELTGASLKKNKIIINYFEEHQMEIWIDYCRKAISGQEVHAELKWYCIKGHAHWFSLSFMPVKNSFLEGGFSLGLLEITAQHEERELIDITNEQAKIGGWAYDVQSGKISWSKVTYTIHDAPHTYIPELSTAINFYKEGADRELISKSIKEAINDGKPYDIILSIVSLQGKTRLVRTKGNPIMHEGKCIKVFGTFQDITEEYLLKQEIATSEERFKTLVYNITDIITLVDAVGSVLFISPSVTKVLGFTQAELLGTNIMDLLHPEDLSMVMGQFAIGLQMPGEGPMVTYRYKTKAGTYRVLESRGNNQLNTDGINGVVITSKDVTERIEAENLQKESHQRLLHAFENIPVCFIVHNLQGDVLEMNANARQIMGYPEEKFPKAQAINIGDSFFENRKDYEILMQNLLQAGSLDSEKVEIQHADGFGLVVRVNLSLIQKENAPPLVQAIFSDITNDYSAQRLIDSSLQLKEAAEGLDYDNFLLKGLNLAEELLNSELAFLQPIPYHEITDAQIVFSSRTRLSNTLQHIINYYNTNNLPIWDACIQGKKPVIRNDYSNLEQTETISGHSIPLIRDLLIPILDNDKVVAILGVGNKKYYYTQLDEEQLTTFAHQLGAALQRKKYDNQINEMNALLQLSQQIAQMGTWNYDMETGYLQWTDEVFKLFGINRNEFGDKHPDFLKMVVATERERVQQANKKAQESGLPFVVDYPIITPDGTEKVLQEHGFCEKDKSGKVIRLYGTVQDITHQKNEWARKELFASISRFFNTENSVSVCLQHAISYLSEAGGFQFSEAWLVSEDKQVLQRVAFYSSNTKTDLFFKDKRNENLTFRKGQGLPGTTWQEKKILLWNDVQISKSFYRKEGAQKSGMQSALGMPLIFGEHVLGVIMFGSTEVKNKLNYFETLFSPLIGFIGIDLKRKMLEDEFYQIFHTVPDLVCIAGTDGFFKRINPAGTAMLGYTEEELTSRPWNDFVHPEDKEVTIKETINLSSGQKTLYFENRYITAKGETIWLAWTSNPVPERGIIYGVAKNITEQKDLQVLLNDVAKLSKIGAWEVNFANKSVFIAPMARQIIATNLEFNPFKDDWLLLFATAYRHELKEKMQALVLANKELDIQAPLLLSDGSYKWIHLRGKAEFLKKTCIRAFGSIQDIHANKVIELALQESYQSIQDYKLALDQSANIVVTNINGIIVDVNERTCLLTGYTKDELIGQHTRINKSGKHDEAFYKHLWDTISGGQTWRGEIYNLRKDGSGYWVDTVIVPLKDGSGNITHYLAIRNDITDRKNYIAEIEVQNRKLREIAFTQSHIVRAPLARLLGLVELIKIGQLSSEEENQILYYIDDTAKELDNIIKDIVQTTQHMQTMV